MTRYRINMLGPRKQLSILPSPSIMLERDITCLVEQPFNGESTAMSWLTWMCNYSAVEYYMRIKVDIIPSLS